MNSILALFLLLLPLVSDAIKHAKTSTHPRSVLVSLGSISGYGGRGVDTTCVPETDTAFSDFSVEDLRKTELDFATEWNRYTLLRQFLDYIPVTLSTSDAQYVVKSSASSASEDIYMKYMGDISWRSINLVCNLMLGWRASDNSIHLDKTLQPITWHSDPTRRMDQLLNFADCRDQFIDYKLSCDLPEDEESTDLVCEALGGYEMFKLMQSCADNDLQLRRKLLIVKWLYVYGFLSSDFPPRARFIPYHQQ